MQKIANLIGEALEASKPVERTLHLPYWTEEDEKYTQQNFEGWGRKRARKGISAARCARVSYLNHEGVRDIDRDLELAEKLVRSRHICTKSLHGRQV